MTNLLHPGTSNNFEALLFFVCLFFFVFHAISQCSGTLRRKPRSQANLGTRLRRRGQRPRQKVKKSIRLVWQNNNSARASRFFAHFLCRPNTTMT